MLVVVYRNRAALRFQHFRHLLEELVARVKDLAQVIPRIFAVFGDDQHGVDGQLRSTATKRLGDGRIHAEPEFPGPILAQVVRRFLIDIE